MKPESLEQSAPPVPDFSSVDNQASATGTPASAPVPGPFAALARTVISSETPTRLGVFEIVRILGEGGMGKVYLARDTELDRLVALKTLRPELAATGHMTERFVQEARSAAKLSHPNIVQVFTAGVDRAVPFFAMEAVDGLSLKDHLQQDGPFSVERGLDIVLQTAKGLKAAWEAGIVHRDIKPGNLMLDRNGIAKITDFGLAKNLASAMDLTRTGAMVGSPYYMSPEQSEGSKHVNFTADIYSLGATLYHLIVGLPPFNADSPLSLMLMHAKEPVPRHERLAGLHEGQIHRLINRMMAKKPEDRHESYDELIHEMERLLALERVHGLTMPPPPGSGLRRLVIQGLIAMVFMTLGVVGTLAIMKKQLKPHLPPPTRLVALPNSFVVGPQDAPAAVTIEPFVIPSELTSKAQSLSVLQRLPEEIVADRVIVGQVLDCILRYDFQGVHDVISGSGIVFSRPEDKLVLEILPRFHTVTRDYRNVVLREARRREVSITIEDRSFILEDGDLDVIQLAEATNPPKRFQLKWAELSPKAYFAIHMAALEGIQTRQDRRFLAILAGLLDIPIGMRPAEMPIMDPKIGIGVALADLVKEAMVSERRPERPRDDESDLSFGQVLPGRHRRNQNEPVVRISAPTPTPSPSPTPAR